MGVSTACDRYHPPDVRLSEKIGRSGYTLTILGVVVAGTDGFFLARFGARSLAKVHAIPTALIALLAGTVLLTNT